jgi:SAM-dependent methyltransferase
MSNWNALAELDPLWTVLSEPEKKFGKWNAEEFFSTGEPEAKRVLDLCKANAVDITFGKMLDFGCGVGRMTRAFSAYFKSCVGLDVSEKMVGLAKKYNSGLPRCEFMASEAARLPLPDRTFDFVFTVLVLQHLPTKRAILNYIAEFVRIAKEGGVIAFQLPIAVSLLHRVQPRRRIWTMLAALGVPHAWLHKQGLAPIQISGISRREVETFLRSQGAQVKVVDRFEPGDEPFHGYYYVAVKQPRRPDTRPGLV